MADALDSKSSVLTDVKVRLLSPLLVGKFLGETRSEERPTTFIMDEIAARDGKCCRIRSEGRKEEKGDGKNGNHSFHHSHAETQSSTTPPVPAEFPNQSRPILPPRGDYQTLLSYQKAEVVYDITFRFTRKFLTKRDRTIDRMIQAARSGKQNRLEGSKAGTTSKETEIKLTNVARARLEELLRDYLDFLRVRDMRVWDKESKEARLYATVAERRRRLSNSIANL